MWHSIDKFCITFERLCLTVSSARLVTNGLTCDATAGLHPEIVTWCVQQRLACEMPPATPLPAPAAALASCAASAASVMANRPVRCCPLQQATKFEDWANSNIELMAVQWESVQDT